jgi:glucuronate isomerase
MLQTEEFSARNILRQMNVKLLCTTDDPVDDLSHHLALENDHSFEIIVLPAFRPDKALAVESPPAFNQWVDQLAGAADVQIGDYESFLEALLKRHDFFHQRGCRLSDHGLERFYAEDFSGEDIARIFAKVRSGQTLAPREVLQFKSAVLLELAKMDADKNWVQQYHFSALRNVNTRAMKVLGPDTGFDTMGDAEVAGPLAKFLDKLDREHKLAKTIFYNLNPRDNDLIAAMIGNFQDGTVPGKMQFVGMLTDSRSFLSYPRHEYFRRILCNMLGNDVENGELPADMQLIGNMVKDICYKNAVNYFDFYHA